MLKENKTQESIIQNQLEAYNQRDLNKFLTFYSSDIKIYNFNEETPFIDGLEDLKTVYSEVFDNSPKLNASIKNRIVFDNKVIDEEEVTGRKEIEYIKVVVIYEVKSNLINKVTFIRKK
jgi:hypothetical protein